MSRQRKRAELKQKQKQKRLNLQDLDVEELVSTVDDSVDGKIVGVEMNDLIEGRIKVEVCVE